MNDSENLISHVSVWLDDKKADCVSEITYLRGNVINWSWTFFMKSYFCGAKLVKINLNGKLCPKNNRYMVWT